MHAVLISTNSSFIPSENTQSNFIHTAKAHEEEWQLDDSPLVKSLIPHGFLVQDEFLGSDWVTAVHADARRCFLQGNVAGFTSSPQEFGGLEMLMLDNSQKVQLQYPALGEAIDAVHSLPFELNKRCGSKLCSAVPGSTVLFRVAPGCVGWKQRIDGSESNGYAATALYVIGCQASDAMPVASTRGRAPFRLELHSAGGVSHVDPCQSDQLILFDDCSVKNAFKTEPVSFETNEWFLICFWIHGTDFRRKESSLTT